jgi:Nuclease-related domain
VYRLRMTTSGRLIRLSRAGTCEECAAVIPVGDWAWWRRGKPLVFCTKCRPVEPELDAGVLLPAVADRRSQIDAGVAGGSTMREYTRRHGNREERIRARWGRLAGLVLTFSEDPLSTRVWERGSVGESKLAAALGKIDREDVIFLHDRAVPRTRGNIDHIVVAPSGVYVVDAKRYRGRVEVRDRSGLFSRADPRLFVGGRDQSKLAYAMGWQVTAVRAALREREDVPVTPVLCFIDAEWPLLGGPYQFAGVRIEAERSVRKLVTKPGPLPTEEVVEVAIVLSQAFPAYGPGTRHGAHGSARPPG